MDALQEVKHDAPKELLTNQNSPPELAAASPDFSLRPAPDSPERAIAEMEKEVSFLARRMARQTTLADDLKQEGLWAVIQALPRYRNNGGARQQSFSCFAMICARNRMLFYLGREGILPANPCAFQNQRYGVTRRNARYGVSRRIFSGDAPISDEIDDGTVFDGVPAELKFLEKPDNYVLARELRDAVAALPGRDRDCVRLVLEDFQEVEIAAKWGFSRQRVHQIMGRAVARLRERMLRKSGGLPISRLATPLH